MGYINIFVSKDAYLFVKNEQLFLKNKEKKINSQQLSFFWKNKYNNSFLIIYIKNFAKKKTQRTR